MLRAQIGNTTDIRKQNSIKMQIRVGKMPLRGSLSDRKGGGGYVWDRVVGIALSVSLDHNANIKPI